MRLERGEPHKGAMNQLTVSLQHSIATLAANGWSARKIARELGVHLETVGRYLRPLEPDSKPAIPPTGSSEDLPPKPAIVPIGSGEPSDSKPAIVLIGSRVGRPSQCAPWSEFIGRAVAAGLSAVASLMVISFIGWRNAHRHPIAFFP